ncbi:uncharacterized protein LOC114366158 isoform X2 [Ostrinia furnacalis]|uniref:uncharacterized protein LOC114366158 isoform X2 n=1 Tax=Ostrinia furnacalis TaxID=93504 RepID=UPI00103A1528|nr:uncharacterized protein LOC114366158 isoform X2 [Ostrinia furnacalis]
MSTSSECNYNFKELSVKRKSIKGQITKFRNFLCNIQQKDELTSVDLAELTLKLGKFESLSLRFDDLQNQIEVLNSDNLDREIDERESIENDFIINIAASKKIIDSYNCDIQQRRESIFHDVTASAQCSSDHNMGFKLPQIQIAKFGGAYFRWLEFHDTFESLIHNNNRISNIHKFHYLVSYLEGEAARIISNFEMSSANYEQAWQLLCNRYNNKRLLTNHHLNSLLSIQSITRESEKSLRFLVDHMTKNLRALSSLGQPTDKWDMLLIFMLSSKLDNRTLTKWEEFRNTLEDMPTLAQFNKFLIDRADVLESINRNKFDSNNNFSKNSPTTSRSYGQQSNNNNYNKGTTYTKALTSVNTQKPHNMFVCVICGDNHRIYDCSVFKSKSVQDRLNDVKNHKLCSNCLRQGHSLNNCRMGPCRECKKRHNTLLHDPTISYKSNISINDSESTTIVNHSIQNQQVILSTALVDVLNPITNQSIKVRALLDCGSQSSFVTKSLQNKLKLKSNRLNNIQVIGIGNSCSNQPIETCNVQLQSQNISFSTQLSCFVLNEITTELPRAPIDIKTLKLPSSIILADPTFNQPSKIDILIGADIFWDILENEQRSLGCPGPKLHNSKLGWLISGPIFTQNSSSKSVQCNHASISQNSNNEVDKMLPIFWDLEEIPQKRILNKNDEECENHFLQNTVRLNNGRFSVKLPLKDTADYLGDTFALAKRRFISLEKRFKRNANLKAEYCKFIEEYSSLGHLSEINIKPDPSYFLCHHAVLKEVSESTKLRVVFDGSAASTSGYSLNDILRSGPNVQDSLFSILIRARQYKYLLTGDIEKMYRQVEVDESDRNLQLILWRNDESQPIKILRLNTLTYGTASASYLSTRCIYQLGDECEDEIVKEIIKNDFYVDDLITGCDQEEDLRNLQYSISKVLSSGCFNLRKYKSNSRTLFQNCNISGNQENLIFSESTCTLGLGWDPSTDTLHFPTKFTPQDNNAPITKRSIMSQSFKIFDPLGLLQKMWLQKIDWDEPVPQDIKNSWEIFKNNITYLNQLRIPRLVLCDNPICIELHSFSDASQYAYGACIYMRTVNANGNVSVKLLCSKSKVAPVKPTTMPRLELLGALLAARLCKSVTDALRCKPTRIIHWCDSSIVLAWLKHDPRQLKSFVANRVNEISEITNVSSWRYVPTSQNPADLITRGVNTNQLISMNLWWQGPEFLTNDSSDWPILKQNNQQILHEIKSNAVTIFESIINFDNYSNFNKLLRSFAYIKRFINNVKNPKNKQLNSLTAEELNNAFHCLCSIAQRQSFPVEYDNLINNKSLKSKSKILSLSPFFDTDKQLILVGGRIDASAYTYEKKHPILLHASHRLTKLYFEREHIRNMHAGPSLLLATVRETVWPVNGRRLARRVVNNCVRCRRVVGKTLCPKMGNLPAQRITPGYPFMSVGLDYAGPFYILNRKGRGSRVIKCYLCLFVCMRYKCIHLEAVSDLSKDAFLMTLRRFIARRGKPAEVFSDKGRNFVASYKEISQFLKENESALCDFANREGIKFFCSPAYAPHFGGIFEAGIKSAKHHIKRVMGNTHLTFEEISTLFAQVEAILNSRPLYPLSSSPNDFLPLSPGHFMIGRPMTSLPAPDLHNSKETSLRRYERLEKLRQHFWNRWQKEYIGELQQRTKWKDNITKLKIGDMVLIHEEHVPPLNWRLGRVARLFPGTDGISRVADVNTVRGCVRRPLTRLCPLPTEDSSC